MNRLYHWILWSLLCLATVGAQGKEVASEVLAKDMQEQIVHLDVSVRDMFGRQETKAIPITIFRPSGAGPFPLVVFNHGRSSKRETQRRARYEPVARYLVAKGFVVMVPTRIGYWETYGEFDPEQSGPCNKRNFEPMSVAASHQVLATVAYARGLAYVDASRWLVAGVSVGGLTSIATVGLNPPGLLGGINFSGGAGGNPDDNPGRPCSPENLGRYWAKMAKTATVPMLWMYWQNDRFWGEAIPHQWHEAWQAAGGRAEFVSFPPSGKEGHFGIDQDMNSWLPTVDAYLRQLGFAQEAIVKRPATSGFAAVADVSQVPINAQSKAEGYAKFLAADPPRAFAVGNKGGWGYATGDYVTGRALGYCQRSGQTCKLYAVDDDVVWTGK